MNWCKRLRKKLKSYGIRIVLNSPVEQIDEHSVTVKGKQIPAETIIWTAGTKGSPAAEWLGLKGDKNGRVEVGDDLSLSGVGHPEIFVIGDTAAMVVPRKNLFGVPIQEKDGKLKPLPGVAQPAIQAGEYAGAVIRRQVRGLTPPKPFVIFGQGKFGSYRSHFCHCRFRKSEAVGTGWLGDLAGSTYYLLDRLCKSSARADAVGDCLPHAAAHGACADG